MCFPADRYQPVPRAHAGMPGLARTRVSRHRGDEDGDWAIHQRLLWSGRRDSIAEKAAATDAVVDEALDGRAGMKGHPWRACGRATASRARIPRPLLDESLRRRF
jgi:hypothetical protein